MMASLAAMIDKVRDKQSSMSYRVGRNWGNAEWTTRGMVAAGVRFRRVAVTSPRETVVGTSDGTLLLLDTGAERLAAFRRNASDYDFDFEASESPPRQGPLPALIRDNDFVTDLRSDGVMMDEDYEEAARRADPGYQSGASRGYDEWGDYGEGDGYDGDEMVAQGPAPKAPIRVLCEFGSDQAAALTALTWGASVLASGDSSGTVSIWRHPMARANEWRGDLGHGKIRPGQSVEHVAARVKDPLHSFKFPTGSPVLAMAVHLDGMNCSPSLAALSVDGHLAVLNSTSGVPLVAPFPVPELEGGEATCLATVQSLGVLLVGGANGRVVVLDGKDPTQLLHSFRAHDREVRAIHGDFTGEWEGAEWQEFRPHIPGATVVVTAGEEGSIKQWELFKDESSKVRSWPPMSSQRLKHYVHCLEGAHEGPISSIKADSYKIVSACPSEGTVKAWNRKTGQEMWSMDGFESSMTTVDFDKDTLVCDGMGSTLCIHDFAEIIGDGLGDAFLDYSEDGW